MIMREVMVMIMMFVEIIKIRDHDVCGVGDAHDHDVYGE